MLKRTPCRPICRHNMVRYNIIYQRAQCDAVFKQDAPSLTLRSSSNNLGLHVHVSKPRRDLERIRRSKKFIVIAESGSTKSYFNQVRRMLVVSGCVSKTRQIWHKVGSSILETNTAIYNAEKIAFQTLREEVVVIISPMAKHMSLHKNS